MKTILVDDEQLMLGLFEEECKDVSEIEIVGKFDNPEKALAYAEDNRVDLAFLDIEMPKLNGLDLSDELRELYPDIIIIFVSAYDRHMRSAIKEHDADWFLLKPYTTEEVQKAVERAKCLSIRQKKRVEIRTFGNFEVLVDGEALKFTSKLAKEIFALIVDRQGDSVTYESMYYEMWPNSNYNNSEASKFRHAIGRLQNTLKEYGIENILVYFPNARAMKCDMVECDLYALMREEMEAIRKYTGRYMNQYTWAEKRVWTLNDIKKKHDPNAENRLSEDY